MLRYVAVGAVVVAGCRLDPMDARRPVRFNVAANVHRFPGPTAEASGAPRTSEQPPGATRHTAVTGTAQFSVSTRTPLFLGVEVEGGRMAESSGSNFAGGYGVIGAQSVTSRGGFAFEVATGWRTWRYELNEDNANGFIIEPRVRGHVWLSPQLSLGAVAGTTIVGEGGWVAGIYAGVHSNLFGAVP